MSKPSQIVSMFTLDEAIPKATYYHVYLGYHAKEYDIFKDVTPSSVEPYGINYIAIGIFCPAQM